jgi:hypothetical protein
MGLLGGKREELQEAKAAREARDQAPEQRWEYLARNLDKVPAWRSSPSRRTTRYSSGPSADSPQSLRYPGAQWIPILAGCR